MVSGFQTSICQDGTVAACAKHFVGYGLVAGGRDYDTVQVGEDALRNLHVPPFRDAVRAGCATVMAAFTDVDGVPKHAHRRLLREVLKGEWGFDGVVVADWNGIGQLVNQGVASDLRDAAARRSRPSTSTWSPAPMQPTSPLTGRPLDLGEVLDLADAVLIAWHPGIEAGPALIETPFGDCSPGGRLPMTFPRSLGHIPSTSHARPTGRSVAAADDPVTGRYLDALVAPLLPFGSGLTYTTFSYGPMRLSAHEMALDDGSIQVSVDVTTTGGRPGLEIVQLYLRDVVADVTRPLLELADWVSHDSTQLHDRAGPGHRRAGTGPRSSGRAAQPAGSCHQAVCGPGTADVPRVAG